MMSQRILFILFSLSGFFWITFGTFNSKTVKEYYGLSELSKDFNNLIESKQELFHLTITQTSNEGYDPIEASGTYQLIPYYQKIYPKDDHSIRYIIQKHPFNGEYQ
jgi:hypothetical protein